MAMTKLEREMWNVIKKYDKRFSNFPTIPLLDAWSMSEVIEKLTTCLKENKDIYEMGFYEEPPYDVCI